MNMGKVKKSFFILITLAFAIVLFFQNCSSDMFSLHGNGDGYEGFGNFSGSKWPPRPIGSFIGLDNNSQNPGEPLEIQCTGEIDIFDTMTLTSIDGINYTLELQYEESNPTNLQWPSQSSTASFNHLTNYGGILLKVIFINDYANAVIDYSYPNEDSSSPFSEQINCFSPATSTAPDQETNPKREPTQPSRQDD